MNKLYAWQNTTWQLLTEQVERLPHALLLYGKAGIGKLDFAMALSKRLLCANPLDGHACHVCAKCIWFNEGSHPDFKWVTPEDVEAAEEVSKKKTTKKTQISVEQVRHLIQALSLTNHGVDSLRVVLIEPAESLNQASANALLKILEEPPNNTLFILVASHLQRLLPTIISRCQKIALPVPSHHEAVTWLGEQSIVEPDIKLAYASGSPLLVLKNEVDNTVKTQVCDLLAKGGSLDTQPCLGLLVAAGMEQSVNALQKWAHDLMLCRFSLEQHYHQQHGGALQKLAKSVHLNLLLGFQKSLTMAKQTAQHPLNTELQLEQLLIQYKKMFTQTT